MGKKIIEVSNNEARDFFMKSESYFTTPLPKYFNFRKILDDCDEKLKSCDLKEFIKNNDKPSAYLDVNYKILCDKGMQYQWRELELIHPMLYVDLVNLITNYDNWKEIVKIFKNYKVENIVCCSLPILSNENIKKDNILNWWSSFEQEIIYNSLKYRCMGITDISNFYSSIYTHTISWAVKGKEYAKKHRNDKNLGNNIDKKIESMHYAQTNGIPQGSYLMDFIAEILLAYADHELSKKLEEQNIKEYKILRYRDDYRIFALDRNTVENIMKYLSIVLVDINLRLNSTKTSIVDNIIANALKPDKAYLISNGINLNNNYQKRLYSIWTFSQKFPNSGQLIQMLKNYYEEIEKVDSIDYSKQIISIITEIMYTCPKTYDIGVSIISKIFAINKDLSTNLFNDIIKKFSSKPNTDYLEIWLQRMAIGANIEMNFTCKLCKKVKDSKEIIWNSDWLNFKFNEDVLIDKDELENTKQIIELEEINYDDPYDF